MERDRLEVALLHPQDDVATALVDVPAGARLRVAAAVRVCEVQTREPIALGHKLALRALAAGEAVRKYGHVIGRATREILPGDLVHVHNLASDPRGDAPPPSSAEPAAAGRTALSLEHRRFHGYRRADRRVGVRNHVLVLSPTGLTSAAARRIHAAVRGTVCVTSGFGRGQLADDARLHFDTLTGLMTHPNVAGVVVVAAGPDIARSYADAAAGADKPCVALCLPDVREDAIALVDAGVRAATRLVREASALRREACDVAELCIAVECGHSDATSGLVCNPLAGRIVQAVVDAGGQAMFSETVEWIGAEHLLAGRAATPDVAQRIVAAVAARERASRALGDDIRAQNPGPQNRSGGLSTLEEKALGAIAKGGDGPIRGVLRATERPRGSGLFLMDTPFFSPESMTAMVAAGAQIVLFTTGAGNSYASLIAPTVKMSANPATVARLAEQIDFAASGVLEGTSSMDALVARGVRHLLDVASGTLTFGEIVGEGDEVVSRLGPST